MKNKKFILLFLLVIATILFVGCNTKNKDTKYSIKYFVDGIENTTIEPKEYTKGTEVILQCPRFNPGEDFSGWYDNKELSGNIIEKITKEDSGDKVFYGKLIDQEPIHIYTIRYYINGIETPFDLNQYEEGAKDVLPVPTLEETKIWNGWYLNEDLTGDKISTLEGLNQNLVLYGTIVSDEKDSLELKNAFSYNSYKFKYTQETSDYTFIDEYSVDNGKYFIHNDTYDQYYGEVEGLKTYFISDEHHKFFYINESHEDFPYYVMSLALIDLPNIDIKQFTKQGDTYVPLPDYLQELSRTFTGVSTGFDSFILTLKDNKVSTVEIIASTNENGTTIKEKYLLEFSDFGTTKVELPKDATDINAPASSITIENIYNLQEGETVITEGVITGVYGNNFYLSDDTAGILVFMGKDGTHRSDIFIGSTIKVTGVVTVYSDAIQLASVTEIERIDKTFNVNPIEVESLDPNELDYLIHELVNVNNLIVETLPSDTSNNFADITFKCSDGTNSIDVFISKHLDSKSKSSLIAIINKLKVDDPIIIKNAHIGYHKGNFQISLTNAAKIEEGIKEVKLVGIETIPQTATFNYTVTLEEILNTIKLYEVYNNGERKEIAKEQYTVDTGNFEVGVIKNYSFTYTYKELTTTCKVVVRDASKQDIVKAGVDSNQYLTVKDQMGYDPQDNKYYGFNVGLPSIGKPKALVIPVEFTDCKAPVNIVSDLEKAFFGTSQDTGWESLQSYYQKASYGKLTIEGTVLEPYNTNKTVKDFEKLYKQYEIDYDNYYSGRSDKFPVSPEELMIKGALEQNDKNINYDNYDTNSDGFIDSIYIIYVNNYVMDNDSLWWAFTTEYQTENYEYYDNVEADFYVFMSYQFLSDEFHGMNVNYNTETIIHETGHLMGLNDYYDYDPTVGPDGGLGGGDMMHNNVGDHNPYSKVMLGWIDPMIVSGNDLTIDLNSFGTSGDSIFVFKNWNETFFDEYFVIDFYTPDGLNSASKGEYGLFSIPGIRVYHVDSRLNDKDKCFSIYDVTKCNNSDTDHLQIALVEADGRNDILHDKYSDNNDLFTAGMSLKTPRWYDGTKSGFTLTVNSIVNGKANISISY